MEKIILMVLLGLYSSSVWADKSCEEISNIADKNGRLYGTKASFNVKGSKGFRANFYSAPSKKCRISKQFLIPNDSVIAYKEFKNEKQTWIYVMYPYSIDKNGDNPSGWMKRNEFKLSGRFSGLCPSN